MNKIVKEFSNLRLKPGEGAFCRLCQHSFILKLGTTVIYVDPFLSAHPARLYPSPVSAEEITNADVVCGTHDHGDHIDRPVWPILAKTSPKAKFVLPEAVRRANPPLKGAAGRRQVGLNAGESVTIGEVKITAVPAAHELLDYNPKTGLYPYLGYIFEGNGLTVYHSGDCCRYEEQVKILSQWKLDLALLPINGRDAWRLTHDCIGCMTYQEAADLAGLLEPRLTVPAHYDMFANNQADPWLFTEYMRVKYPRLATQVAKPGEIYRMRGLRSMAPTAAQVN